jgi:uncharacterized protein (DUF305 family)
MQNNKDMIVGVVILVVGLALGYMAGLTSAGGRLAAAPTGSHMMPNGDMMLNSGGMDMDDMMTGMMSGLQGKTGDYFDQAFLSGMIVHHEGAVAMAEEALKDAKHQEIIDLAKAIITAQNKEISDMKLWQKTWYNK